MKKLSLTEREAQDRAASQVQCTGHASHHELCGACYAAESDARAAATLRENDRQAAELARYVEHKDEVMAALVLARARLRDTRAGHSATDEFVAGSISSVLRRIEGRL